MSCKGCEANSILQSDALAKVLPTYDPEDLFPEFIEVNNQNPGAAGPIPPYEPSTGYTPKDDTPPSWTIESPDGRRVEITLSSFWADNWHGSCAQTSQGCEEETSCVLRLTLRYRIKVSQAQSPDEKPAPPAMPGVGVNSTAPVTKEARPVGGLRVPGDPLPDPLPPDETGPTTQERGNPLPTVTNTPGATVGAEYSSDGSVRTFRDYYVEAVYKTVPGCGITYYYEIDLDEWEIEIDGDVVGSPGSSWTATDEPDSTDFIGVGWSCFTCEKTVSPPPDGGSITPSNGININPNSIED